MAADSLLHNFFSQNPGCHVGGDNSNFLVHILTYIVGTQRLSISTIHTNIVLWQPLQVVVNQYQLD